MILSSKDLHVKTSTLAGCGKGLFTKVFISKGTIMAEYKGKISTWKDVDHDDGRNPYIYYVSRLHVIDAKGNKESIAHFANDAKGYKKEKGVTNNARYIVKRKRVFIEAVRDIQAKEEIFISYGKEYWDVIRKNKIM